MSYERHLPVFLLVDCSAAMSGEPIQTVVRFLKALLDDLRSDPQSLETVWVSLITFGDRVEQPCPLTELMAFHPPKVKLGGGSALGAALAFLESCLDSQVHKSTPTRIGDFKPLVFLLSSGQSSDEWRSAAERLRSRRPASIIAVATDSKTNRDDLKQLTDMVIEAQALQPDALKAFFKWVSASVKCTSDPIGETTPLPPLPAGGINIVP